MNLKLEVIDYGSGLYCIDYTNDSIGMTVFSGTRKDCEDRFREVLQCMILTEKEKADASL